MISLKVSIIRKMRRTIIIIITILFGITLVVKSSVGWEGGRTSEGKKEE